MALKTWLWNLGTAGVAVAAGGCTSIVDFPQETEGTQDTEGDTEVADDGYNDDGYNDDGYYDTDYYSDEGYYYDTDYYNDGDCDSDDDCELGVCIDPGEPFSYCEPLPIPDVCPEAPAVALSWVREGEGAGTAVGMPGAGQVVLLDADAIPVSLSGTEAAAVAETLPVALAMGESVIGAAGADLDGDGNLDVLLSVQDDVRLRVVAMLSLGDGMFAEGPTTTFESLGDPAQIKHYADGSMDILARLDSGLLFEGTSLGDGSFSTPEPSAWAIEPITGFGVGQLDVAENDDVAVGLVGPGDGESTIAVLLDGGELPVGAVGSANRSLHVDANDRWILALDSTPRGATHIERIFTAVDSDPEPFVVPDGDAAVLETTVTDLDADGHSDVVLLHEDGHLTVIFQVTADACMASIESGAVFESMHRPGTGDDVGLVLSGAAGVLALGPGGG